jgi:hypothetical protein
MKKNLEENRILAALFGDVNTSSMQEQELEIDDRLKLSKYHVNLERRYVSKAYSSKILNDAEWYKQLHFLYFNNFNHGTSFVGNNNFKKYYPLSNNQYNEVCGSLEQKGFICREKMSEKPGGSAKDKRTETTTYLAPVYDPDTDTIIKQEIINNSYYTNVNKVHYAEIPKEGLDVILKDKRLDIVQMRFIFKLYRFNKYKLFKGVNPNFIHREEGKLNMSCRLMDDLRLSRKEVEEMLEHIERLGYIYWNRVNVYEENLDQDTRLRVTNQRLGNSREVEIITPIYQLEREVIQ